MASEAPETYLWVDVETTGVSDEAFILEAAFRITMARSLEPLGEPLNVIVSRGMLRLEDFDQEAWAMHLKNGLLSDINGGVSAKEAGSRIRTWLEDMRSAYQLERMPLAGSSIHFDRFHLLREWGFIEDFITHRNIDVSTARTLTKVWRPSAVWEGQAKHRALADIDDHIAELKHYGSHIWETL